MSIKISPVIQLLGNFDDLISLNNLRNKLKAMQYSEVRPVKSLLTNHFEQYDFSNLLSLAEHDPPLSQVVYLWGDNLLNMVRIEIEENPFSNFHRNLKQKIIHGKHVAWIEHVSADRLVWCEDLGFFDCITSNQQIVECIWRLERCISAIKRQTEKAIFSATLPDSLRAIDFSASEKNLLRLLVFNNHALKKQEICHYLNMRSDTRTLENLISKVNKKCSVAFYRIIRPNALGYRLVDLRTLG